VGLALAVEAGRACYVPVTTGTPGPSGGLAAEDVLEALRDVLVSPNVLKAGHGERGGEGGMARILRVRYSEDAGWLARGAARDTCGTARAPR
jgi:hypothetical protein